MDYLSYGTLGSATPGAGRRYEPNRYSSTPVRPVGDSPRHLAPDPDPDPDPAPVVLREQPARELGGSARAGHRWPLITDALFLVAYDDWARMRLHLDVFRLGLGAAVLAELVMGKYVTIGADGAVAALVTGLPPDPVAARVMRRLLDEREHLPVRDWLAFLADPVQPDGDIYDQVGRRMLLAGMVEARRTGLLRRATRYEPKDINIAAWCCLRLARYLQRGERLSEFDTVMAGLILAIGLHSRVFTGDIGRFEAGLRHTVSGAPVAVGELMRHTEIAVGSAVITGT